VILHVNHRQAGQAARVGQVLAGILGLLEEQPIEPRRLARLRVHLDWIQYRANFREPVTARRAVDRAGEPLSLAEIAVDLRRADAGDLRDDLARALAAARPGAEPDAGRVVLEDFLPIRESLIWRFNRLFWQHLSAWEASSGRTFEQALPGGKSDASHPGAIADSVAEFWTLLRDLDRRQGLPAEIFALEIGVGTGARASAWLDRFRALDEQRGTSYYPRLRFLLADSSLPLLDRTMEAVQAHRDLVSLVALEARNPLKTLSFLRYKVLHVHLTNVYDNLPHDEVVRRDGRLYLVEVRAYVQEAAARRLAADFDVPAAELARTVAKFIEIGPDLFPDRARGVAFWRAVWDAVRLEEQLVGLEDLGEMPMPPGLDRIHLEDLLAGAPDDVRFHLSSGAAESFVNTVPLLHPRGQLQVQDIFVTSMDDYRLGFWGPGKLDGSVVNWVNGALLREIGARAGYDVHFAPFHYVPGSRTSVLYTTQRD
jgi:hypothetical protein